VLEAGEATSLLPDESSVVANPDAYRGAQVLQRAGAALRSSTKGTGRTSASAICAWPSSSTCQKRLRPMSTQLSSVIIARTGWFPGSRGAAESHREVGPPGP
jgi:hypothetical protein